MSLYILPEDDILADVNLKNGLTLKASDVIFGIPKEASQEVQDLKGTNTQIRITGNGTTWDKFVIVDYHRLPLTDLNVLIGDTIKTPPVATTLELIKVMNYLYGLVLSDKDIVDEPITLDENGVGTVTLKALTNSLGWIGQATFTLNKGSYILPFELTNTELTGFEYPNKTLTAGQAEMHVYWLDFTAYNADFTPIAAGTALPLTAGTNGLPTNTSSPEYKIVSALRALLANNNWGLFGGGSANWNLCGARVVYNGPVTPELTANQTFKYVMYLQLSDGRSVGGTDATRRIANLTGQLVFHYNDPYNPFED